ncbi:MAG: hypothetical protein ACLUE2_09955 [Bacteroides cellulosilyticus]
MKKGLITSILALTFTGLQAQPLPATPKLVVTLTIDQLRTDYMEAFSTLYGEKGFKRLMREGKVFLPDRIPFQRNRPRFCHRCHLQRHDAFDERHHIPVLDGCKHPAPRELRGRRRIYGQLHRRKLFSSQLLTSTIADELKVATRNKGLVYAIAPSRDAAVLAAGHTGNGAFWLNENTGKWCSTTYYSEFPWWVSQYNERKSPDFRIRDMVWEPAHPINKYTFLPGMAGPTLQI